MPRATSAPLIFCDGVSLPDRAERSSRVLAGGWLELPNYGCRVCVCALEALARGSLVYKVRLPPVEAARARLAPGSMPFSGTECS